MSIVTTLVRYRQSNRLTDYRYIDFGSSTVGGGVGLVVGKADAVKPGELIARPAARCLLGRRGGCR